ncbi:hypothetical protein [Streptomonospora wellingtoniae]|uniref:Uncharacterized protein n=1 Tax=Streptomonospora wellingtoniae TaxID=3075544 RepID=A0ABU2KPZ8_9ACTN|nr:hypothetical protein [Streptomonospora sp. DSM 45055]MDT0301347.1 hypothetical protein [Streptomonospora sp. DSM 45055]
MTANKAFAAAALLRHEARRCGPGVGALPVAGVGAGAAVAAAPVAAHPVLLSVSGAALAGLAALCAVAMLGRDRMLELQSTLPVPVPVLVARRRAPAYWPSRLCWVGRRC